MTAYSNQEVNFVLFFNIPKFSKGEWGNFDGEISIPADG
ncbi:hypothetical protein MYAER_3740 [Microcystis aeruginosa NIES-2549]|uniref:Uncharacterized protein n=1 Tax=Microcystis aeruginosa NIES-2549 TaxID=1641812 RepID=A0A0F6U6H9_MICAE|nr:hypothetical protein MYAER_3740 [Microcystis aeruginosa NIES-2549]AOC54483.1 hypothetical protein amyaer_3788 [Microcystis aeruginosa NIES-2481]